MVKDRLKELEEIRLQNNLTLPRSRGSITIPVDDGHNGALLLLLDKIGPLYKRIKELHDDSVQLHRDINNHNQREKLSDKINDVRSEARSLYKTIKEINSFIESDAPLISHVARSHHSSLVTFFSSANVELMSMQSELRDKHKKYVQKELNITGQEVTDEELEDLLDKSAEVFNQNILMETKEAKQRLLDVQQRHDDIIKIEKSIIEVNQLFQELALLVREQGEKVDRIESYVYEAQGQAQKAQAELKQAQISQVKSRKKKCIIITILSIVAVIFVLIIVFSLLPY